MRTGEEYKRAVKGKRNVYINGEKIGDVTKHEAFTGIVNTVASLYDYSSKPENNMTFRTEWGNTGNKVFMIPHSREDLLDRHSAIARWAEITVGFVGRSPDHVGSFLAGFAANPSIFSRGGKEFADNVLNFYRKVIDEDLYVAYTIIPPQVDRSKSAHELDEKFVQVGVAEEVEGGIIVRGSQMLGTAAAVSDYIFVSCIPPLKEGDEDYAISFYVPLSANGVKLYCRTPYAPGKPSIFDYPLSTRFDESDAFVVFDDVFVPWENVFVYRNVKLLQSQFFETPAHVLGNNQAQIRLSVKLKFISGIARKIATANVTDKIQGVIEKLGELASLSSIVEGMIIASENNGVRRDINVYAPNPRFLYGAMGMQSEIYPRTIQILRELSGAGVLQVPSSYRELESKEIMEDLKRYIRSPDLRTEERIKLFRLAWDVIGSEFAGRHLQYEMFYAGAPYVAKLYSFRNYDFGESVGLVDNFLLKYDLKSGHSYEELRK